MSPELMGLTVDTIVKETLNMERIHQCFYKVVNLFSVTIVFQSEDLRYLPKMSNVTYVLLNPTKQKTTENFTSLGYYNYIIIINKSCLIKKMIDNLKNTSIWDASRSPRGKFVIVTFDESKEIIFQHLWSLDVRNIILIVVNFDQQKIYKAHPHRESNNCITNSTLKYFGDCRIDPIEFSVPSRKKIGCRLIAGALHVLDPAPFVADMTSKYNLGLFVFPIKLVGEVLGIDILLKNISADYQKILLTTGSPEYRRLIFNGDEDLVMAHTNRFVYGTHLSVKGQHYL